MSGVSNPGMSKLQWGVQPGSSSLGGSLDATLTGPGSHFNVVCPSLKRFRRTLPCGFGLVLVTTSQGRRGTSLLFPVGALNKVPRESFLDGHLEYLEGSSQRRSSTLNSVLLPRNLC